MKKNPLLLIGALVVLAGAVYFVMSPQSSTTDKTPSQSPSPTPDALTVTPSGDADSLRLGGSSYADPNGVFVFLYPSDYTLDTEDKQHIRIFKRGPQERPQSEMTDGVLMVFEVVDLDGQALSDWVDERIKTSTADGTLTVSEQKSDFTLNDLAGYTYKTQGFGEAKYYVLRKDPNSDNALVITVAVNDPQNKDYQSEVNAILSTVELLK